MTRRRDVPSGRVLRLLLRLYPAGFRERYGDEMAELFRWRLARARREGGRRAQIRAWIRMVSEVTAGGIKERWGGGPEVGGRRTLAGGGSPVDSGTGGDRMGRMVHDLHDAARRLARAPFFTAGVVLIVALGIGVNTAVFTLVDALLFRPPPYADPDRVVTLYQDSDDGNPSSSSFPAYRDMSGSEVFSRVAARSSTSLTWEREGGPRRVAAEYVTSGYLPVLGLQPSLGRWFDESHDRVGAGAYAVVSHHTWRTAMGGDPSVVGSTVRLGGQPVTVLGVGPRAFNGSGGLVLDFWLSISSTVIEAPFRVQNLDRRQDHWYDVEARLAPGVSVARAQEAMNGLAARLAEEFPELNRGRDITVFGPGEVRVHPRADGQLFSVGTGLMAVVLLILLLACSNLANLLLVRGISRGPEVAMRRALGASRARVAGLFLLEALLLSAAGGLLGLALARWSLQAVAGLAMIPLGAVPDLQMDHRVLFFATALVVLTGVAFGVAPGLTSARTDLAGALREGQRSASPGRATRLFRNGLVALQVAVSLVLLVGAGLAVRSLALTRGVDPGVDVDRIAWIQADVGADLSPGERAVRLTQLVRRAEALPGATAAGFTTRRPVESGGGSTTTVVEGYDPPSGTGAVELAFVAVDGGYFRTMGIPVIAGRAFDDRDTPATGTVVMMSETAARRYWGSAEAAVGRRVRPQSVTDGWREVVGVVGDVKVGSLQEPDRPLMYFSTGQVQPAAGFLVARTGGDPGALVAPLRRIVEEEVPGAAVRAAGTMEDHLGGALRLPRLGAAFIGAFSILAVVLASLGIYAVVSFSVLRRTGELGIRMALGAARGRLVRMVVGEVLAVVLFGVALGFGLAVAAAPRIDGLLFRVSSRDPVSFGLAALLLVTVSLLAAWLPARRAALTDPVHTLRAH